jgi:hypothetical protein
MGLTRTSEEKKQAEAFINQVTQLAQGPQGGGGVKPTITKPDKNGNITVDGVSLKVGSVYTDPKTGQKYSVTANGVQQCSGRSGRGLGGGCSGTPLTGNTAQIVALTAAAAFQALYNSQQQQAAQGQQSSYRIPPGQGNSIPAAQTAIENGLSWQNYINNGGSMPQNVYERQQRMFASNLLNVFNSAQRDPSRAFATIASNDQNSGLTHSASSFSQALARRIDSMTSNPVYRNLPPAGQQAAQAILMGIDYSTYSNVQNNRPVTQSEYSWVARQLGLQVSQGRVNISQNLDNIPNVTVPTVRPGTTLRNLWEQPAPIPPGLGSPMRYNQNGQVVQAIPTGPVRQTTPTTPFAEFIRQGGDPRPGLGFMSPGMVSSNAPLTTQQTDALNRVNQWVANNPPPRNPNQDWLAYQAEISNPNSQLSRNVQSLAGQGFFNRDNASKIMDNFQQFMIHYYASNPSLYE